MTNPSIVNFFANNRYYLISIFTESTLWSSQHGVYQVANADGILGNLQPFSQPQDLPQFVDDNSISSVTSCSFGYQNNMVHIVVIDTAKSGLATIYIFDPSQQKLAFVQQQQVRAGAYSSSSLICSSSSSLYLVRGSIASANDVLFSIDVYSISYQPNPIRFDFVRLVARQIPIPPLQGISSLSIAPANFTIGSNKSVSMDIIGTVGTEKKQIWGFSMSIPTSTSYFNLLDVGHHSNLAFTIDSSNQTLIFEVHDSGYW